MGNYLGNQNLKLTGVEYLCLCMQANPGRSKRYYLRRKNIYQRGSDPSKGGSGMTGYFKVGGFYDYNLWVDYAPRTVKSTNWMGYSTTVPRKSEMHLTELGWKRANQARLKLGLNTLPEL